MIYIKACSQKDPLISVILNLTMKGRRWFLAFFFFSLIGLKLSGRNHETINCFFIRVAQSEGSVVACLCWQPQSFPLLSTAFVYLIFQLTSTI